MTLLKVNRPNNSIVSPFWNNVLNDLLSNRLPSEQASFVPAVNIAETKTSFEIHLSAPGFEKDNFKIEVENDVLTVSGEHQTVATDESKERTFTRKEFSYGSFKRSWTLPDNINCDEISANYDNGILKLNLPKLTQEKVSNSREIKIG